MLTPIDLKELEQLERDLLRIAPERVWLIKQNIEKARKMDRELRKAHKINFTILWKPVSIYL